uniref:Cilia- and flagella-associated protein 157 n=1 Tax=Angiostrongylus cantonensis TaxID=6313 RepID=A0A0K0DNT8_ANGCA
MVDNIVRQLCVEFRKKRVLSGKASDALFEKANVHEELQQSKFDRYLEVKSKLAKEDIIRLELEKEQQQLLEAEQEMAAAEQSANDVEKRLQARVAELKSNVSLLRKSELDSNKEQSMRDMYQDMLEKLSELVRYFQHIKSRESQRCSLVNERLVLEEQVSSLSMKTSQIRDEVDRLSADLDATGYEGLIHATRRSAMALMKAKYTEVKSELLRLRLGTHTLRIRARSAQSISALEK